MPPLGTAALETRSLAHHRSRGVSPQASRYGAPLSATGYTGGDLSSGQTLAITLN